MKKFFAKEFLWLLLTLVLALPLTFLLLTGMDIVSKERSFVDQEKVFVIELFLLAYAVNIGGIYLVRMVIGAIKVLATQPPAEEK